MSLLPSALRTEEAVKEARESGNFDPIPAGKYIVELVKATRRTARSGTPRLSFQLKVVDTPDGDPPKGSKGRMVFYASNLDATGAPWIIRAFDALGIPHDAEMEDIVDAYGTEVLATVGVTEYQGNADNDVKQLTSLSDVPASADSTSTEAVEDDWDTE